VDSDLPVLRGLDRVSLYIHIPFCSRKCAYCDFFSVADADVRTVRNVIQETVRQTAFFLERLGPRTLVSVYIGGGTPSSLEPALWRLLLQELYSLGAANAAEYTVEANPESLDEEFLSSCTRFGVTRLSVGIQSFRTALLQGIGRNVSMKSIGRALDLIHRDWAGDLNLDLLSGLPGQSARVMSQDIREVLGLRPAHISCYTLTLEEGTRLYEQAGEGRVRLPRPGLRDSLWLASRRHITTAGYSHYEISNFALRGKECIHNLGYWLLQPYVGAGPGAVSTLPVEGGGAARFSNPRNLNSFLRGRDLFWGAGREDLTPAQLFFEQLMLGFRLKDGIPASLFPKRFGRPLPEIIPGLWKSWRERGFVRRSSSCHALTLRARLILNRLLRELAGEDITTAGIRLTWP
jgi:oxygen-independent coproporphyrinogen-3 oxidase